MDLVWLTACMSYMTTAPRPLAKVRRLHGERGGGGVGQTQGEYVKEGFSASGTN